MDSRLLLLRRALRRESLAGLAKRLGIASEAILAALLPESESGYARLDDQALSGLVQILPEIDFDRAPGWLLSCPHLLSTDSFSREDLERLFYLTDLLQPVARRQRVCRVLEGAILACLFFEASTRTRLSFTSAFSRLGGSVMSATGFNFSSVVKGESLEDTGRVLAGYADVIVVRHPELGSVARLASASFVPVINGGDGPGEHPSQALLDVYTIESEFMRRGRCLDGLSLTVLGDLRFGRTVHSLLRILSLYRSLRITLLAADNLQLPQFLIQSLKRAGHEVVIARDWAEALVGAEVVYATRIQKERLGPQAGALGWRLDRKVAQRYLGPEAIILHPLPRDSSPKAFDLSSDLDEDKRLVIFRQADNGVAVRMALFAEMLGVGAPVDKSLRPVVWRRPRRLGPRDWQDLDYF